MHSSANESSLPDVSAEAIEALATILLLQAEEESFATKGEQGRADESS